MSVCVGAVDCLYRTYPRFGLQFELVFIYKALQIKNKVQIFLIANIIKYFNVKKNRDMSKYSAIFAWNMTVILHCHRWRICWAVSQLFCWNISHTTHVISAFPTGIDKKLSYPVQYGYWSQYRCHCCIEYPTFIPTFLPTFHFNVFSIFVAQNILFHWFYHRRTGNSPFLCAQECNQYSNVSPFITFHSAMLSYEYFISFQWIFHSISHIFPSHTTNLFPTFLTVGLYDC